MSELEKMRLFILRTENQKSSEISEKQTINIIKKLEPGTGLPNTNYMNIKNTPFFYLEKNQVRTSTQERIEKYSHLSPQIIYDYKRYRNQGYGLDDAVKELATKYGIDEPAITELIFWGLYGVDLELYRKDPEYRNEVIERLKSEGVLV